MKTDPLVTDQEHSICTAFYGTKYLIPSLEQSMLTEMLHYGQIHGLDRALSSPQRACMIIEQLS